VGDRVAVAEGKSLRLLDPVGLRPVAEATVESAVTGGPWADENSVFVQTDSHLLFAFDADSLEARWNIDVGAPVADDPLRANDRWFVATQTGSVFVLGDDGQTQQRFDVLTPLSHLVSLGRYVVAVGLDGALHPLPKESAAGQADGTAPSQEAQP
jgi:outer membrane protein assembly factor BamB